MKKILDACCGPRGFWFDKTHKDVLYVDCRELETVTGSGKNARARKIHPDKIMDFRKLDLRNNSFKMVVFDPPHLFCGENSYMGTCYGPLSKETWQDDIKKGFSECFRVLENEGFLIFKWNESDILLKEILKLTPEKPLFGHPSGKAQKTHWVCFMKSQQRAKNRIMISNDPQRGDDTPLCEHMNWQEEPCHETCRNCGVTDCNDRVDNT